MLIIFVPQNFTPIKRHRSKGVEALKDEVDALIVGCWWWWCLKGRGIHPRLAVNPLEVSLILADEGIGDKPGCEQIEVDAVCISDGGV